MDANGVPGKLRGTFITVTAKPLGILEEGSMAKTPPGTIVLVSSNIAVSSFLDAYVSVKLGILVRPAVRSELLVPLMRSKSAVSPLAGMPNAKMTSSPCGTFDTFPDADKLTTSLPPPFSRKR